MTRWWRSRKAGRGGGLSGFECGRWVRGPAKTLGRAGFHRGGTRRQMLLCDLDVAQGFDGRGAATWVFRQQKRHRAAPYRWKGARFVEVFGLNRHSG